MQVLYKKDSGISSTNSPFSFTAGCQSWGNSIVSHARESSPSKSLSLRMGIPLQHCNNTKQLRYPFQDQDSSSTQSTGQSYPDVVSLRESQSLVSAHSGYNETREKPVGIHTKPDSSMGTQDFVFLPSQVDHSQSTAYLQFHCDKPYFGALLPAAYGPQVMQIHHPRIVGTPSARVPLPLDLTEYEPIYVNAKQYNGIIRRRQYRAKLEAQNKLVKARKPYLHESRHLHALKRARGSGGRFLNSKTLQESSKTTPTRDGSVVSDSVKLYLTGNMTDIQNGASTTASSDITSSSNFSFSGYLSQGQSGSIHGSGKQHHPSLPH